MNQPDTDKMEALLKLFNQIFPNQDQDTSPGFDTALQASKGEKVPPGVEAAIVDNPLTVVQQAHAASDRIQQLSYQNAFDVITQFVDTVKAREATIKELHGRETDLRDLLVTQESAAIRQNEENNTLLETVYTDRGRADESERTAREYERRALLAEAQVRTFTDLQNDLLAIHGIYADSKKLAADSKAALKASKNALDETIENLTEM